MSVDESFKGDAGSSLRIVQLGGVVGNVRMTVHGAIQWHAGKEVVLFLEPALPGTWQWPGCPRVNSTSNAIPRRGLPTSSAPPRKASSSWAGPMKAPRFPPSSRSRCVDSSTMRWGGVKGGSQCRNV